MSAQRPTGIRWLVLGLACVTSWLLYLHRYAWGVIKSNVKDEFHLDEVELGWIDAAFNGTYALSQVPAGLLGDLFGPALILPSIIALWSLCLAAMVLGTGAAAFFSVRAVFGVAQAGAYPNLSKVSRSWFPLSSRASMQGLIASLAGRMGGAFAPLIIGTLLMGVLHLEWRATLIILAVVGLLYAITFRLLFHNRPEDHPWTNQAEQQLIEAEDPPPAPYVRFTFNWSAPAMLSFIFLMLQIFLSAFADQLFVNWIFYYLDDEKGYSKIEMGIYGSLPLFGGAFGGLAAGFLIDWLYRRTRRRRFSRSAVGFMGKILSAILVVFSLQFADARLMMVVLMAGKFFTDWSQPAMWATTTDVSGPAAGRIFGLVNMAGSLGAFLAGPVIGEIIFRFGWTALFLTIATVFLLAAVCWLFIDATKPVVIEQKRPLQESSDEQPSAD